MKVNAVSVCLMICLNFSVSFAVTLNQSFYRSVGSVCELPDTNGKKGVCTLLKDCPEAKCLRKHRKYLNWCGMFPREAVCCDQERKSVRVCRFFRNKLENTDLIISGTEAKRGEFPHMALITYKSKGHEKRCGGSLISERFVLSAAHCFPSSKEIKSTLRVYLGGLRYPADADSIDINKIKKMENIQIHQVSDVIIHPEFKTEPEQYNDIALLMLKESVNYTNDVLPACLYDKDVRKGTVLTATGWGVTDPAGSLPSENLMTVKLVEFDMDECKCNLSNEESYKGKIKYGVLPTMLCAWDEGGGDTCRGDSGGPLSFKPVAATQIHSIVGITSFGPNPCSSNIPSIYTRVSKYLNWIECLVWPNITQQ